MKVKELCQSLEWDSDFFQRKIAQVTVSRLTSEDLNSVIRWCSDQQTDCLYFLADSDDSSTVRLAENNGFHLVDVRVTLHRKLDGATERQKGLSTLRPFQPQDLSALKTIAKSNHHDSRFYQDLNFSRPLCDSFYETWIEKSCKGYADRVWVAEIEKEAVGYVSCHLADGGAGKIGLFGIAPEVQTKGVGPQLLGAALGWFYQQGVKEVSVVTQGRNGRALRFYQRAGFLIQSLKLFYHKWFQK